MRQRYEFTFFVSDVAHEGGRDAELDLLGSTGWEIRGIAPVANGRIAVALQRVADDEALLPAAPAIAATLDEPLVAPGPEDFEAA